MFGWRKKTIPPLPAVPDLDREVAARWAAGPPAPAVPAHVVADNQADSELAFAGAPTVLQTLKRERNRRLWRWTNRVGLLLLVGGCLLVLGLFMAQSFGFRILPSNDGLGERLAYGAGNDAEEIYYTDGATAEDAGKLGRFLQHVGIFNGQDGKTVQLAKDDDGFVVAFVLRADDWSAPELIEAFRELAKALSHQVFDDAPVVIHLCDRVVQHWWGRSSLSVKNVVKSKE